MLSISIRLLFGFSRQLFYPCKSPDLRLFMNKDYTCNLKYSKSHNTIIFSSILYFVTSGISEDFTFFKFYCHVFKKYTSAACMDLLCKDHTVTIRQVIMELISCLNDSFEFISRSPLKVRDGECNSTENSNVNLPGQSN